MKKWRPCKPFHCAYTLDFIDFSAQWAPVAHRLLPLRISCFFDRSFFCDGRPCFLRAPDGHRPGKSVKKIRPSEILRYRPEIRHANRSGCNGRLDQTHPLNIYRFSFYRASGVVNFPKSRKCRFRRFSKTGRKSVSDIVEW